MTGATGFTRASGLVGLLAIPAMLVWMMLATSGTNRGTVLFGVLAFVVVMAVVPTVGLLVRHRGEWWVRPVAALHVLAILFWLAGASGRTATAVSGLAFTALLLGVFLVGELPRWAPACVLLAMPLDRTPLDWVGAVLSAVGFFALLWAMWREPAADLDPFDGALPAGGDEFGAGRVPARLT